MSATDELRRLLDERGVKWDYGITGAATTKFRTNGVDLTFMSMRDGLVCTTILTPAQAIAATLGSETCKEVYLLMATDIGDGREEVLGAYATEEAATAAISENQFGYALHHVRKWGVTS